MVLKKTKKTRKAVKMRGKGMGTHGGGARKKRKKSGHHGGGGMSGSGKRGDQKKTLITKLYGHGYFGKQGITSKKTERDKRKRINIRDIEINLDSYLKRGIAKKTGESFEINLREYKILGGREKHIMKNKLIINAKSSSKSAKEIVEEAGGKIVTPEKKVVKKVEKKVEKSEIKKESEIKTANQNRNPKKGSK